VGEPTGGEFVAAVGQVAPTEHAQFQYLRRRQLRLEARVEVGSLRLGQGVDVAPLHEVVDDDQLGSHDQNLTQRRGKTSEQ
jgi:hypothetical protein